MIFRRSKLAFAPVLLAGLVGAVALATPALAQQITGSLVGTVTDPTDAVIPGVRLVAVNLETGAEQETTTDETGAFQFPLLRAGRYLLIAESQGFQRLQREPVIINTAETVRLEVSLEVGELAETVTVTEQTPLLQSEEATIGHVVEQHTITSIPLATRNFTQILGTSAGVVGSIMNADRPGTGSDSVSVNGARRGSNNLLVDGAPTSNALNMAPDGDGTPSIEFLGEFKMLTSLYSAEYGRNLGSTINVTTRSGSNQFHGAAYEFFRNTVLNARPFFNPERGKNNQNQFGANVGGPIIRNKTFFFGGWESSRQRNSNSGDATLNVIVPTLAQRQGDFGDQQIIDPTTGEPFPNNVIPQDRLNPTALQLQERFVPQPNFSAGGAVNYFAAAALPTDIDQYTFRIDHRFSEKDSIFGRWFDSRQTDFSPFTFGFPGLGNFANRKKKSLTVNETHVFSPTLILETRFAYDQTDQFTTPENATDFASVGLNPLPVTRTDMGIPRFEINDYQSFGSTQNWADYIKRFTGAATMTWVKSKHTTKFGFESRNNLYNPQNVLSSRGRFTFTGEATGDSYADFLLTHTRSKGFGAGAGELKMRDAIIGTFVSDEWRVNPSLTLTLGMRYEAHWQPAAYNLDMTNWYPDFYTGIGSLESSGVVQGGQNGIPPSTVNGDWNNVMPRVGVAWKPGENWVIRTGAGLYFDQRTGQIAQQAFSNPPTFQEIQPDCTVPAAPCDISVPDNFTFLDPEYDPELIPFPTSPSDSLAFRATDRNTLTDSAWQYNLSVQRQLTNTFLLETAYVGTKGTHLMARRNINPLVPAGFDPANPQPGELSRRYPGFGDILYTTQNGSSTYHSFQSTLRRRTATNTIQLAYTFGKTLGNGDEGSRFFTSLFPTPWWDFSRAKGPANFDRTHRVSFVFTQELPDAFSGGVGKAVFNDWSFNGFLVAQTGTPVTVTNRDSGRGLGGAATSPTAALFSNVDAGMDLKIDGSTKDNLQNYINSAAWSKAPFGTVGDSGRGMFRGPGQWNLDFSLFKEIPFTERVRLQFRSEFFNLFNHANFANPNSNLDSLAFGQISDTSVNARLIQFALKLTF